MAGDPSKRRRLNKAGLLVNIRHNFGFFLLLVVIVLIGAYELVDAAVVDLFSSQIDQRLNTTKATQLKQNLRGGIARLKGLTGGSVGNQFNGTTAESLRVLHTGINQVHAENAKLKQMLKEKTGNRAAIESRVDQLKKRLATLTTAATKAASAATVTVAMQAKLAQATQAKQAAPAVQAKLAAPAAVAAAPAAVAAAPAAGTVVKEAPAGVVVTPDYSERQKAVVKTMKWAWFGYKKFAWGKDELNPVSRAHHEWFGLGLTLIDALDTLYIMGMKEEFKEARDWVDQHLTFQKNIDVNLFETSIRVLGGLLSTYHLSGDQVFLTKAKDLGERLLPAFKSPSGIPFSDVNIGNHRAHGPNWGSDSSTAEVTTVQLEFKYLAHVTGDKHYGTPAERVNELVDKLPKTNGLVPIYINAQSGRFSGSTITLGARGDSYYEYLVKQWLQTGGTERKHWDRWEHAMDGVIKKLWKQTSGAQKLWFVGELINGRFSPKMDHLVCFLPGALALGAVNAPADVRGGAVAKKHMEVAKELLKTCVQMYKVNPTNLAPEIAYFNIDNPRNKADIIIHPADTHNLLRPETMESLFILWRITGDEQYRSWGWEIYEAFEKWTRIETGGYSSLRDVTKIKGGFRDKMESFFLGETIKYMYLLFDDTKSVIDLNKYVINTEAHPLPIWTPDKAKPEW